ncbi:MAG TPA: CoA transferase [Xanthobacteraceae bacterium]|jgi:benzylsuccinate CoA-transferase BbsF subunit
MRFSDLRVLDFCWVGAGAFVTRLLADLGADVIKVESHAHPDNLRLSGPHKSGARHLEGSGYFASRNTNKKSIALNMGRPEARALARQLARKCSVVTNNFRPGIMERWGLGYAELAAADPSLIYLAMPMQGSSGPHKSYIGFGSTISAISGLVEMSGSPDRAPIGTGTHYPDHIPNPGHALVGLLAAIFHRARTGEGQYVELAQLESTVNLLGPSILRYSASGVLPRRTGNRRDGSVPCGVFPCMGDDVWCAIEIENDAGWQALVEALGRPPWMTDPAFDTLMGRSAGIDVIEGKLAQETRRHQADALVLALQARGIACSVVETSRDVMEDRQLNARGYWRSIDHAEMGRITVNVPPFFSVEEGRQREPAPPPLLGEQTREIATTLLGLSDSECTRLMKEEVLW